MKNFYIFDDFLVFRKLDEIHKTGENPTKSLKSKKMKNCQGNNFEIRCDNLGKQEQKRNERLYADIYYILKDIYSL